MFGRLLFLFIVVPLVDLTLLLVISQYLTWQVTIATVIISGIIGAWLASRQGRSVKIRMRDQMMQNQLPTGLLTDGAMILFAAGLLITPGLITDAFGFSLLIPPIREFYKRAISGWVKKNFQVKVVDFNQFEQQSGAWGDPDVVEGRVVKPENEAHSDLKNRGLEKEADD